jgi:hypothetical protein
VSEFGLVFADVFDALWVLAEPPLTFGWTLIEGWMLIVGSRLMTAAATALALSRSWARCSDVILIGATALACVVGCAW